MAEAPYAIYRHAKLKSMGLIHASAQHMTRQRDTPNADPARRDQNMVLIGGDDPPPMSLPLSPPSMPEARTAGGCGGQTASSLSRCY